MTLNRTIQEKYMNINNLYFFKVKILFPFLLFAMYGSIYSQTLSAEQIYEKVKNTVVVILAYDNSDELSA